MLQRGIALVCVAAAVILSVTVCVRDRERAAARTRAEHVATLASVGAAPSASAAANCVALRDHDRTSIDDIIGFVRPSERNSAANALIIGQHDGALVERLRNDGFHVDVLDRDATFIARLRECAAIPSNDAFVGALASRHGIDPIVDQPQTTPTWPGRRYDVTIVFGNARQESVEYLTASEKHRLVVGRWVDQNEQADDAEGFDFPLPLPGGHYEHVKLVKVDDRYLRLSRAHAMGRWPYEPHVKTFSKESDGSRDVELGGYLVRRSSGELVIECPVLRMGRTEVHVVGSEAQAALARSIVGATFAKADAPPMRGAAADLSSLFDTNYFENFGMTLSSVVVTVRGRARLVSWESDRRVYEIAPTAPIGTVRASDWRATEPLYLGALSRAIASLKSSDLDGARTALHAARDFIRELVGEAGDIFELYRWIDQVVRAADLTQTDPLALMKIGFPAQPREVSGRYRPYAEEKTLVRVIESEVWLGARSEK